MMRGKTSKKSAAGDQGDPAALTFDGMNFIDKYVISGSAAVPQGADESKPAVDVRRNFEMAIDAILTHCGKGFKGPKGKK